MCKDSGLVYYETLDSLPVGNALEAGNLAYVAANQRMYVSNGTYMHFLPNIHHQS